MLLNFHFANEHFCATVVFDVNECCKRRVCVYVRMWVCVFGERESKSHNIHAFFVGKITMYTHLCRENYNIRALESQKSPQVRTFAAKITIYSHSHTDLFFGGYL